MMPPPSSPSAEEVSGNGFRAVYLDEHLIVIEKDAGLVVHPSPGHSEGTLSQQLAGLVQGGEDSARAGIVHRLDKGTSGLLVVARDKETHAALQQAIAAREVKRRYSALVVGMPPATTGSIDAPIGRDRRQRTKISIDTDKPRNAVTHFEVERQLVGYTLLRVELETGRTHQIRVHLSEIGFPVAGDPEYGKAGLLGLERQFLHASELSFAHPVTGKPLTTQSELPNDLRNALQAAQTAQTP